MVSCWPRVVAFDWVLIIFVEAEILFSTTTTAACSWADISDLIGKILAGDCWYKILVKQTRRTWVQNYNVQCIEIPSCLNEMPSITMELIRTYLTSLYENFSIVYMKGRTFHQFIWTVVTTLYKSFQYERYIFSLV